MERLILSGAPLIDGSGTQPVRGKAVVVEGARIAAVVEERAAPSGTALRLDGLTLLPGLINAHVHLCLGGEPDPVSRLKEEPLALTAGRGSRPLQRSTASRPGSPPSRILTGASFRSWR
ncbi:MAG: hypothetical protein AABZ20_06190 [candidate division NC10 bacterium]